MPLTIPLTEPIVATAVVWLTQVPPSARSLNVIVPPWHTGVLPVIAESELTVTTTLEAQPDASTYETTVVPPRRPVTVTGLPEEPTVATEGLLLTQ